ncbi:MAG: ABC transporter substrate-binding protein [Armatimonadota bacterium]|nr:ABC transporter substrate-binding protein [Armatimonadota bacterium]MDR5703610.1 ABC transporter substrate-binding protein [Armatimonadota bacterium]MDR7435164.1 ABC transporter substrate-binding protein [Armatimonadota bacterium]
MRWTTFLIGVILMGLALSLLGQGTFAGAATSVTFMLDWFPNPDHVPVYVALQKGLFSQEGLRLRLQIPADPNDPLKLVAAGKVDIAISYQPTVTIARSQGLPVKSVGILIGQPLNTIMFLADSGIRTPADLKGKRIGYSVAGFEEALLSAVAASGGLQKGDYQLINIAFNLTPALLSRQVDAVVGAYRNFERIQLELKGKKVGMFEVEKYGVPEYYELVVIASDQTIQKQPEMVKRFIRALSRGIAQTRENPQEALNTFFVANPKLRDELNRRAFFATLPYFARSQVQSRERWQRFQDFLFAHGVITKKSPVDELFTNAFVPR